MTQSPQQSDMRTTNCSATKGWEKRKLFSVLYIIQLYLECASAAVFFGINERRTRDGCCLINVSSETRKGMIAPWRMRSARGVDFSVTRSSSSPGKNRINNSESSRLWITLLMLSQCFYHSRPPLFRYIFVLSLLQQSKNYSLT